MDDLLDSAKAMIAAVVIWLSGEGGRIIVAGGAGAMVRWLQGEKRRIRDGALAAAGGAVSAYYLWPIPLLLLSSFSGQLERTPEHMVMAGFLTGALGMSFVKIVTAMLEARAKKIGGGDA